MQMLSHFKNLALIVVLTIFVLLVNYPVISFDMMYPEQPIMYLVNQQITSFSDLLNVYLHPQLLHFAIPFFRPSGHFLIYQILLPFLGWHNTRALIIVNLIFLALTGFLIIKFYNLLFPRFKAGGYIAFAIYLMHPALSLSRLIVLHFEFAYVFFLMLGLYCFAIFCKKNRGKIQFHSIYLIFLSLLFYTIALTFKEAAIILGPIFLVFFFIALYDPSAGVTTFRAVFQNKQSKQLCLLLLVISLTLAIYLTLPWPVLAHPLRNGIKAKEFLAAANVFLKIIFNLNYNLISSTAFDGANNQWGIIIFPPIARFVIWSMSIISIISIFLILLDSSSEAFENKKSLLFLGIASLLSLILPIGWAMGMPWHLSLTLLFLSFVMGFSFEYFMQFFWEKMPGQFYVGGALALLIGLSAIAVDKANVKRYATDLRMSFSLMLNRNAVLHPPKIKEKLNANSVLIVADTLVKSDYFLGGAAYPFSLLGRDIIEQVEKLQRWNFVKLEPSYNGTLFRWAYLNPTLQEELYPFRIDNMAEIPNETIYNWLQNYDNIFSVGYDKQANWYDQTAVFKENLLKEQRKRHLTVHPYQYLPAIALSGESLGVEDLGYADPRLCKYQCDKDSRCAGFTYITTALPANQSLTKCVFFNSLVASRQKFCSLCTGFIKTSEDSSPFSAPGQPIAKMSTYLTGKPG